MFGTACLVAIALVIAYLISVRLMVERLPAAHLGVLLSLVLLGANGLLISLAFNGVSFRSLNVALFLECVGLLVVARKARVEIPSMPTRANNSDGQGFHTLPYLATIAISFVIALRFFTLDLVPSSMTGDPPRHLLNMVHLWDSTDTVSKPTYRLLLGYLMPIFGVANDRSFVAVNIALFALLNGSTSLLLRVVAGNASTMISIALAVLVATGYSLFSLIYGYYTLILSASLAISGFAVLMRYGESHSSAWYWIGVALLSGTALTHAFLTPAVTLAFLVLVIGANRLGRGGTLQKTLPGLVTIGGIAIASLWRAFIPIDGQVGIVQTISQRGFVDETLLENLIVPGVAFMVSLAVFARRHEVRFLLTLGVTSLFALGAFVLLREAGIVAPYYANRMQIIVLPLLLVPVAQGLIVTNSLTATKKNLFAGALVMAGLSGYVTKTQTPLFESKSENYFSLRNSDESIYAQNAKLVANSPLQFTAGDRDRLTNLAMDGEPCVPASVTRIPVMGTDHSAIWFQVYSRKLASFGDRKDGYILPGGYIDDARDWFEGRSSPYIAVIRHIRYTIPEDLIQRIRREGTLVCRGETYDIYVRKPLE